MLFLLKINSTITSISSPPGRGGISVIRISGPKSIEITNLEILRLGKAPQVLDKFQNNVDYTKYKYKGKSAYWRLNHHLKTVKIYDYELVESGLPGQPIGRVVRNAAGKEIIKMN